MSSSHLIGRTAVHAHPSLVRSRTTRKCSHWSICCTGSWPSHWSEVAPHTTALIGRIALTPTPHWSEVAQRTTALIGRIAVLAPPLIGLNSEVAPRTSVLICRIGVLAPPLIGLKSHHAQMLSLVELLDLPRTLSLVWSTTHMISLVEYCTARL